MVGKDLLARAEPNVDEILLALIIASAGGLIFFTVFDISIHDNYLLDDISRCYVGNDEAICLQLFERHGCDGLDQLCIGELYWTILNTMVLLFGSALFILRFAFGKLAGANIDFNLIKISGMWFLSGTVLFYTGWLDYLYYVFQDKVVPSNADGGLPWLNFAGGFELVKRFGENPNLVEATDMYMLMAIGLVVLFGGWFLVHLHHKRKGN